MRWLMEEQPLRWLMVVDGMMVNGGSFCLPTIEQSMSIIPVKATYAAGLFKHQVDGRILTLTSAGWWFQVSALQPLTTLDDRNRTSCWSGI